MNDVFEMQLANGNLEYNGSTLNDRKCFNCDNFIEDEIHVKKITLSIIRVFEKELI